MLFHCHSTKDTVATIDPADMKEFVEDVVLKILTYKMRSLNKY
jgi:hypothetical protein